MLAVISSLLLAPAAWLPQTPVDRRAVLSGAATAAVLASPLPAMARSKEKAAEKALQKATAAEARQAMKEYKYAPRPVLEGNAETGYTFKAGTTGGASQGELAGYFKDKGSKIQAEFKADKARAAGASKAEADKLAADLEAKEKAARKAAYEAKRAKKSEDEIQIAAFCKTDAGKKAVDNVGRPLCAGY